MKIEIWSDVACPWCYIGKRRFESALSHFEHRDQVEVLWHSFQLTPDAPRTSNESLNEMLAKKYGMTPKQAANANIQVAELAAKEGLDYHFEKITHVNTFDAHRLIHLAATHGLQGVMKERLMKAYWTDGVKIGEIDELVKIAEEVGISGEEARTALNSDAYADAVRADKQMALELGVTGVPFFVIDNTYGISGAQPAELFSQALERSWSEAHPLITIASSTPDANVCNDESCTIL